MVQRDSSAVNFGRAEITFVFSLFIDKPVTVEGSEDTGVPVETHNDQLQEISHTKVWKFKSLPRPEPAPQHW